MIHIASPSWFKQVVLPEMVDASQAGVQRAASPLPGFGVSPQTLFLLVCSPPQAEREKKRFLGTPQTPAGRNLHPFRPSTRSGSATFRHVPSRHLLNR